MTLADIISRCQQQLRLSPVISAADVASWLRQAIRRFCVRSRWLDKWTIIVCKANRDKYLLPGDHIATTGAYYDGVKLEPCTAFDAQMVDPATPVFYYEDEWEADASEAQASEFVLHYALNEFWPLQLMRAQSDAGRKTLTLLAAPPLDGEAPTQGAPVVGVYGGYVTQPAYTQNQGMAVYIASSEKNLTLFYKATDEMPPDATQPVTWNDFLGVMYTCGSLSLALSTEDDEYDRYRSWLYGFITDSVAAQLNGIAINQRMT